MNKIAKQSQDVLQDLIQKMRELYPSLFNDEKNLNEDELRNLMSNFASKTEGKYEFNWAGKLNAKKNAFTPSRAMLKPDKKRSIDFDTTENLIVEGDNLEVLKQLQKAYSNRIKCIYLDPPYNTGSDKIYPDNFSEKDVEYWKKSGAIIGGVKLDSNTESQGRYHSNWLNMIYPRLLLARNLLNDKGIIYMSIDDHEVHNLRKILDSVFGEENFVLQAPTIMNLKGNQDEFAFAGTHEYTLVYAKNKDQCKFNEFEVDEDALADWEEDEKGFFKKGANLKSTGGNAPRGKRPNLFYPIYVNPDTKEISTSKDNSKFIEILPITNGQEMSWRWSKETLGNNIEDVIVVVSGSDVSFYKKQRPQLGDLPSKKPKSTFYKPEYSSGNGTNEFNSLLNVSFGNDLRPKPLALIKDLIQLATEPDDIILDFFAGSGTTGQAVMELNRHESGKRKFILVQIPEFTKVGSGAYNAGYKTIFQICIERVKRTSLKLQESKIDGLDIGFKVFGLAESFFPENQYNSDPDLSDEENRTAFGKYLQNVNKQLDFSFDEKELMYEVLLKDGFTLNFKAEKVQEFTENVIYKVTDGEKTALLSLDSNLHEDSMQKLQGVTELRFLCLERAVDTTKKWNLKNMFGDNLWVI